MDLNNGRILLVDDELNILKALERELHEWAKRNQLTITTAISAVEALGVLEAQAGNTVIVVSDLRMPEMKGSDFLLEVHRLYPDIITILLTGYSETPEIVKAVSAGIFSFMVKPWERDYLVSEMQKALDFGNLKRQNAKYLRIMEEELKWAGELQKAILQPNLPKSELMELQVSYRPLGNLYCGGDYYDVIPLSADRYLLLIGDVAGHGVRAAFVTGILKAVIYPEYIAPRAARDFSPSAFLGWLNNRMNFELRQTEGLIITFFAAVLDLAAGRLRYANAGHPHPFLIHSDKTAELPVSGPGLGFSDTTAYEENTIDVLPGDVVTLFTDGLLEVESNGIWVQGQASQLFGKIAHTADYHRQLMETALRDSGASDFSDDVTLLTARLL